MLPSGCGLLSSRVGDSKADGGAGSTGGAARRLDSVAVESSARTAGSGETAGRHCSLGGASTLGGAVIGRPLTIAGIAAGRTESFSAGGAGGGCVAPESDWGPGGGDITTPGGGTAGQFIGKAAGAYPACDGAVITCWPLIGGGDITWPEASYQTGAGALTTRIAAGLP
jgi:hypothetical protein